MSLSDFFDIGDVVYVSYETFGIPDYPEFLNEYVCADENFFFKMQKTITIHRKKCIVLNKTSKLVLVLTEDLRKIWVRNYNCKLINSEA